MPKSKKKYASKNTLALLFIALPGITYLIINNYIPIVGTFIAFKKFSYAKGIWGSPWCGLINFIFLFLNLSEMAPHRIFSVLFPAHDHAEYLV